jgi:O-antigen/teichoic acid export membrane protein
VALNIRLNSVAAIAETLVNGLTLFALYAYVNRVLGVSNVGVWALVVATGSITRVADMGVGQGLQQRVAVALAANRPDHAVQLLQIAFVAVGAIYAVMLGAFYYPARLALHATLSASDYPILNWLLPLSFASFWVSQLAWLALFALCGTHRVYLKCLISMFASIINLILTLILARSLGLLGLAIAQIAQSVTAGLLALIALKHAFPNQRLLAVKWDSAVFRGLLAYGWKLQVVAILVLLYEPLTKFVLGRFFGTAMVGLYELATRMVQQVRLIVVAPNNALLPTFAAMSHDGQERYFPVVRRAQQLTDISGTIVAVLLIGMLPSISEIWLGSFNATFVFFGIALTFGWFSSLYTAPLYYLAMALDRFRWVITGHATLAILNALLCFAAGYFGNERWLVAGTSVAFLISGVVWMLGLAADDRVDLRALFEDDFPVLIFSSLVALTAGFFCYFEVRPVAGEWLTAALMLVVLSTTLFVGMCLHPQRASLLGLMSGLLARARPATSPRA